MFAESYILQKVFELNLPRFFKYISNGLKTAIK